MFEEDAVPKFHLKLGQFFIEVWFQEHCQLLMLQWNWVTAIETDAMTILLNGKAQVSQEGFQSDEGRSIIRHFFGTTSDSNRFHWSRCFIIVSYRYNILKTDFSFEKLIYCIWVGILVCLIFAVLYLYFILMRVLYIFEANSGLWK